MRIPKLTRPVRAATMAAMLTSACNSGHYVTLPAPDLSDYADIDAVVLMSRHHSLLSPPGNVLRGKGAGAKKAMGDWASGAFDSPTFGNDPAAGLLLLGILIVGLPVAAAVGAANAHSGEEIDSAAQSFRDVASDEALFGALDQRVAKRMQAIRPGRWDCVEALAGDPTPPCAKARRPATLIVGAAYSATAEGRSSPDLTLIGWAEARLIRAGSEPVTLRWRYESAPMSYFRATRRDGTRLRKAVEAMQDALAAAIVRDLFVEPRAERFRVTRKGRVRSGSRPGDRQVGDPIERPASSILRMALRESFPSGSSTSGQAIVTTGTGRQSGHGCAIAAIDGDEPQLLRGLSQPAGPVRIALLAPGARRLALSCPANGGGDKPPEELEIEVEAGRLYCADRGLIAETSAPHRC